MRGLDTMSISNRAGEGLSPSVLMQMLLILALLTFSMSTMAAKPYIVEFGGVDKTSDLQLSIGKSEMIYSKSALDQVVIGNPDIADLKLLSSNQVLILGKKPGRTNLVFRDKQRSLIALMDIVVGYDLNGIKRKIYESMPDESMIQVRGSNDSVILSGQVSSLLAMDTAMAIAETYVPKTNVVNMIQVGGAQQVMLEVRIAEVSRNSLRDLGVGWNYSTVSSDGRHAFSIITQNVASNFLDVSGSLTSANGLDTLGYTVKALETRGLAKVLAEPNLVALSGQEASFLAGGEVPIPVAQTSSVAGSVISVDYKEFGVGLKFTPTVLNNKKINLKLNSEVSDIDTSNSVATGPGISVPALTTRRAATTVEMADGQSFAIAGLLSTDMNNAVNEVPGLGQIPILGALFRSSNYQRQETELVILVTPRLVKPTMASELRLPTDGFVPPNWFDQYLMGSLEGVPPKPPKEKKASAEPAAVEEPAAKSGGVDGSYGHNL